MLGVQKINPQKILRNFNPSQGQEGIRTGAEDKLHIQNCSINLSLMHYYLSTIPSMFISTNCKFTSLLKVIQSYRPLALIPKSELTSLDFPELTRPTTPTAVYLASSSRRWWTISAHFSQRAMSGRWERATSDRMFSSNSFPHCPTSLSRGKWVSIFRSSHSSLSWRSRE